MAKFAESKLTKGDCVITLELHADDIDSLLETTDMGEHVSARDMPSDIMERFNGSYYRDTNIEIDHWSNVYIDCGSDIYVILRESLKETQKVYSKLGYSKNNAWLKAIETAKSEAKYINAFYNDQWSFVGFAVTVEYAGEHKGYRITKDFSSDFNSLWGIEWDIFSGLIDNERQVIGIVPDLINGEIVTLTEDDLKELYADIDYV